MLKSGRENASQIICVKISINDQIYPGKQKNDEIIRMNDKKLEKIYFYVKKN